MIKVNFLLIVRKKLILIMMTNQIRIKNFQNKILLIKIKFKITKIIKNN